MVKKCVRRCLTSLIIQKGFHSAQPSLRQNRVGNAAALPILSCHSCLYVPHGDGLNKGFVLNSELLAGRRYMEMDCKTRSLPQNGVLSLRWAHSMQRAHSRKKKGKAVAAAVPLIQYILLSGKILLLRIIESKKHGCR